MLLSALTCIWMGDGGKGRWPDQKGGCAIPFHLPPNHHTSLLFGQGLRSSAPGVDTWNRLWYKCGLFGNPNLENLSTTAEDSVGSGNQHVQISPDLSSYKSQAKFPPLCCISGGKGGSDVIILSKTIKSMISKIVVRYFELEITFYWGGWVQKNLIEQFDL